MTLICSFTCPLIRTFILFFHPNHRFICIPALKPRQRSIGPYAKLNHNHHRQDYYLYNNSDHVVSYVIRRSPEQCGQNNNSRNARCGCDNRLKRQIDIESNKQRTQAKAHPKACIRIKLLMNRNIPNKCRYQIDKRQLKILFVRFPVPRLYYNILCHNIPPFFSIIIGDHRLGNSNLRLNHAGHVMIHFRRVIVVHGVRCIVKCRDQISLDIRHLGRVVFHAVDHVQ